MPANHHRLNHIYEPLGIKTLILGCLWLCLALGLTGCTSMARLVLPAGSLQAAEADTPKSRSYYHYLKAQRLLAANEAAGAAQEYEAALEDDPQSARLELELATLYQRLGEVKKALLHVEKALKLDPKQQEAHFLLAGLHVGPNQLEEATAEYERILVLDPDNREARLFLAALYAQQRRFSKAIRTIQELVRLEPSSVVGYYYLGRFYLENDQLAEAKKELHRALTLDPKFVPAMFDLATVLEKEKQYNRAMALYRRALRHQPNNSRAWANIGRLQLIMHRYGDAQKAFQKVKEIEKGEASAVFHIGLIYLEQKLPDEAIREFRHLVTHPRFKDRIRYYIALALEDKGDFKAAAREYQLVERDSEHFIPARLRLAFMYYQQKDNEQARRILNEIRGLAPDREEIYLTISYFYEEEKRLDQAIATLKEGLDKVPRPLELHFRLAILYEKTKKRDESISHIKKVLELDPKNADAQNFLGYTYADLGVHLDEAERLIRAALAAKPGSGHIIDSLGWVFFRKGYLGKAVVELERAFRIMPQDGTVAEHLGDAYFQQKRYREALRLYRQALGLENNNPPELRQKIQKLEQLLQEPSL